MCRHTLTTAMVGMAQCPPRRRTAIRSRPGPGDELVDHADLVVQQPEPQHRRDHVGDQERQQDACRGRTSTWSAGASTRRSPTASTVCSTMLINTYSTVTTSAFQNSLSWTSRVKLSKPMNLRRAQHVVLGQAEVQAADERVEVEDQEPDQGRQDEDQRHPQVAACPAVGRAPLRAQRLVRRRCVRGGSRRSTDSEASVTQRAPGELTREIFCSHRWARIGSLVRSRGVTDVIVSPFTLGRCCAARVAQLTVPSTRTLHE